MARTRAKSSPGARPRGARPGRAVLLVVLVVGLALALGGVVLLRSDGAPRSVPSESGAPGRLVASQATIDLGRVPFDKLAEARFELGNTGGETVRLVGAPRVRMLEGC